MAPQGRFPVKGHKTTAELIESNHSCQDLHLRSLFFPTREKKLASRSTTKSVFVFVPVEWMIVFFGQTGPESEKEI